jgi:hypothetical protein
VTRSQRQNQFDRFFLALAREYSRGLGLEFVGTIRKLPPPPFPGQSQGPTRYFVNAFSAGGEGTRLVEFNAKLYGALRRAAEWVESGKGPRPSAEASAAPRKRGAVKRVRKRKV